MQHFHRNFVGEVEVGFFARGANPAERPEAVVEAHRPHNIFHIRGIFETTVGLENIGPGAARFKQESVAVVKEIHAAFGEGIDGFYLTAQRFVNGFFEAFRLLGHHAVGFFKAVTHGVVAARKGVVQRTLVGAEVHLNVVLGNVFPKVHRIAEVGKRTHGFFLAGFVYLHKEFVEVFVNFVHPALRMTFLGCVGVDFGGNRHHPGNVTGLGLRPRHTAKAAGNKQFSGERTAIEFAPGVKHRDGGAVHNALRSDIHIRTGRHLAVLCYAQRVVAFPIVGFGVVGNHHAVGYNHSRCVFVRGIEAHGVSGIHHKGLLVAHLAKILHC